MAAEDEMNNEEGTNDEKYGENDHLSEERRKTNRADDGLNDAIFNEFKETDDSNVASVSKLLDSLRCAGLMRDDPRLQEMMQQFKVASPEPSLAEEVSAINIKLKKHRFIQCINSAIPLITKVLQKKLVIPDWLYFCEIITDIYNELKFEEGGKVATYIPQLAKANPKSWGVAVCTIDGQQACWGDYKSTWCLQSVSKPLSYGIALDLLGNDVVHSYVGQEPSGRLFNEICLDRNMKPHNPMVNAGAIIISSLLRQGGCFADRFQVILDYMKRMAGGGYVGFSNPTYLSERENADRNYALGYYMKEHKCFPDKVNFFEAMDLYFQQCSILTTCQSAAVMAATLANGGVCPLTGERVIRSQSVRDVLSLMYSCGMYDYSGQFAFQVGLPAKSGVSGGMILVIPNLMGFALWSPPLGPLGNTIRGVRFAKMLTEQFNFHNYDGLVHGNFDKMVPGKINMQNESAVFENCMYAAFRGNLMTLKRCTLPDMNQTNYDDRTILHVAAVGGHLDTIKYLVETCKVSLNAKDRWGKTPLDDAKFFNHKSCVTYLEHQMEKTGKI